MKLIVGVVKDEKRYPFVYKTLPPGAYKVGDTFEIPEANVVWLSVREAREAMGDEVVDLALSTAGDPQ